MTTAFVTQQFFCKETEANDYSDVKKQEGYVTDVFQDVYDYTWCVDVYMQQQGERAA